MTMSLLASISHVIAALVLCPLLPGIINRTKAKFAGRQGQPLLQTYYDLAKLFRKGAVYSQTTTMIFKAGPIVGLAAMMTALLIVPGGGIGGVLAFPGDLVLLAAVLGLARFMTVLAALDTGSAFEGMGASREVQFSMLAEPALLLSLAALAVCTGCTSLTGIYARLGTLPAGVTGPASVLVSACLLIVYLTENARIPVDDPNTHLELTMIHEVMVLDHGGVDLGFIQYGSALKLWVLGELLVHVAAPIRTGYAAGELAITAVGLAVLAVGVGVIESTMARLKLVRVPQMLVAASVLSGLAVLWSLR
jgi:formate hydrogenlyase subunit 4